jgi:hypothetical protein
VSTLLLSASSRHDRKPSFGIQNILCQHASPSKRWTTLDLGEKFKTVRASDGLQHAKPFWHRYFGSLSAKLETILDGCFTLIHSRQQQLAHEAYISAIIRRGKMTSWHSEFMQWSSHGGINAPRADATGGEHAESDVKASGKVRTPVSLRRRSAAVSGSF